MININKLYIVKFYLTFFHSNLSIAKLNTNHTGKYECKLNSSSGTRIQSISLTVISNKTKFCGVEGDLPIINF